LVAFHMYAVENQGYFPTNFAGALPFVSKLAETQHEISTNHLEILYQGRLERIRNPSEIIVLREKESWEIFDDTGRRWGKVYGFADGHIEIRYEPENNFEAYEKEHLMPPTVDR
jgi:hypothetical protein